MQAAAFKNNRLAFSLIEVVLALGILSLSVIVLLGLMTPALQSVSDVTNTNRAIAVVDKVNGYLRNEDFEDIYNQVFDGGKAVLLAYNFQLDPRSDVYQERIFSVSEFSNSIFERTGIVGSVFKVTVSASGVYKDVLLPPFDFLEEGFLALEVKIYALPAVPPGESLSSVNNISEPGDIDNLDLLLVYNMALNR